MESLWEAISINAQFGNFGPSVILPDRHKNLIETTLLFQMNQATHFMDGSQVYGTNGRDAAALREKTGGLLKTSGPGADQLPLVSNPTAKCLVDSNDATCFNAGKLMYNLLNICQLFG